VPEKQNKNITTVIKSWPTCHTNANQLVAALMLTARRYMSDRSDGSIVLQREGSGRLTPGWASGAEDLNTATESVVPTS